MQMMKVTMHMIITKLWENNIERKERLEKNFIQNKKKEREIWMKNEYLCSQSLPFSVDYGRL